MGRVFKVEEITYRGHSNRTCHRQFVRATDVLWLAKSYRNEDKENVMRAVQEAWRSPDGV